MNAYPWLETSEATFARLIRERESFVVQGLDWVQMMEAVTLIESILEREYLTWRTYSKGRMALLLFGFLSEGLWYLMLASLLSHRIVTFRPHYVLCKDFAFGQLRVIRQ